jgi:hypothetical protein
MSSEEIRGPWGTITTETMLIDGPPTMEYVTLYYLNGQPISEDEARRLVESIRPPEGSQP